MSSLCPRAWSRARRPAGAPWLNEPSEACVCSWDIGMRGCVWPAHRREQHLSHGMLPRTPPHRHPRLLHPLPAPRQSQAGSSLSTEGTGPPCRPGCVFILVGTPGPVCVWRSPRWTAALSALTRPLCRPKTRGTTTSSTSCWLGCLPSSGRPSACRRLRPTTT